MNTQQKIIQLRDLIKNTLSSLITNSYVLWDLPYHANIGDTLIWQGENTFLEGLPYTCIEKKSMDTYRPRQLDKEVVILLHGGGNFGDVWRKHQDYRIDVIRRYPHNKIIVLPQTVGYLQAENIKMDAQVMAAHPDLILCARDERSYEILRKNFKNEILMLPDMAFCISPRQLQRWCLPQQNKLLFVKRLDKELLAMDFGKLIPPHAEIRDWPTLERQTWAGHLYYDLLRINAKTGDWLVPVIDRYAQKIYKDYLIRQGVRLVSRYEYIYTTRLHAAILSVLLGKKFCMIDNSYGKNSTFFHTWLHDLDGAECL